MTEEAKDKLLGTAIGSWVQWVFMALIGFAGWYINNVIAPINHDLAQIQEEFDKHIQETNNHRREDYNKYVTKEYLEQKVQIIKLEVLRDTSGR
jgi:hypothetical protein